MCRTQLPSIFPSSGTKTTRPVIEKQTIIPKFSQKKTYEAHEAKGGHMVDNNSCVTLACAEHCSSVDLDNTTEDKACQTEHSNLRLCSAGLSFKGVIFSMNINTVNQSPKLTLQESSPPKATMEESEAFGGQ